MLDSKGNMFVEEDDIIELMLQNRQAKILPRDTTSFRLFDSTLGLTIINPNVEYECDCGKC